MDAKTTKCNHDRILRKMVLRGVEQQFIYACCQCGKELVIYERIWDYNE